MKSVQIAVLGFGTVGSGVYRVVTENYDTIANSENLDIQVKRILVRDFERALSLHLAPKDILTTDINDILHDEQITIVVECMGGVEPARSYILSALGAGKTVVTANKEVISKHWHLFTEAARKTGAGLYIEGTVGGGIPLLRTVTESLQANVIEQVMGIINGTTNFILTKMSEDGRDFAEVLKEAQQRGYAEADPTADVEGFDSTYKLSILSSLAFHTHMPIDAIYREGITKLTAADFHAAKQLGYEIKLLAIGKKEQNRVEVRVHPTMIKKEHPLASVRGAFNAIFITGNAVGNVMLYGRGAGQMPTASAVMGDVLYACHHDGAHRHPAFKNTPDMDSDTILVRDFESKYCIRTRVSDKPGVMSAITGVFAKHQVSLKSVLQFADSESQEDKLIARITFLTHTAHELAVQAAIEDVKLLDCIEEVESVIRVEE